MGKVALFSAALVFWFLLLVCIDEAGRIDKR